MPTTSVHAEAQVPSITTGCPVLRSVLNLVKYVPICPPLSFEMRSMAEAGVIHAIVNKIAAVIAHARTKAWQRKRDSISSAPGKPLTIRILGDAEQLAYKASLSRPHIIFHWNKAAPFALPRKAEGSLVQIRGS